jgi:glycine cleavage system H lipoate-binding protein/ABC-type phosphate transport system substrate-binding protein
MKTRIFLLIGLLLLNYSISIGNEAETGNKATHEGSINVYTSAELYNLTLKWASEYSKINPLIKINVIKAEDNSIAGMLNSGTGIGFVSAASFNDFSQRPVWNMVVGRDVIVPVMNAKNPFADEIYKRGITSEELTRIFGGSEKPTWGMLLGNSQNIPLHYYTMNDESVNTGIEHFLKIDQFRSDAIKTSGKQEMIAAIQRDPDALGFCNLVDLVDVTNQSLPEQIRLVPIDKNGNGKIDYMEDIYASLQDFTRGVWIGKYPKALTGTIYSVSSVKPQNESELAFLKWVLSDGQQFLSNNGYSDLVYNERQTQLEKLNENVIQVAAQKNDENAILKMVLLVVLVFGVTGFLFDWGIRSYRRQRGASPDISDSNPVVFNEDSLTVPKGIYFDKTHTWAFMEKDGSVKIGIDDFLQHITGPLSRVGLKPAGVKIKKGDPLLTIIQNGKHLTIYSPVTGTITASNKTLINNSSAINTAPYTEGWVYMIEPTNWLREIQFLTMADQYKTWLKDEFTRLKDFFASALQVNTPEYAHVVLQDGGALKDSILADLGPEVWEDFQTKFIDNTR